MAPPIQPNKYRNGRFDAASLIKYGIIAFWAIFAVIALTTTFYTVPTDSSAVIQRFGRYDGQTESGLHIKAPFGIDKATVLPTKRQLKMEFGYASTGATNPHQGSEEPEQEKDMVTGDLNAALVEWVVQYRISDPKDYMFATSDPEDTMRAAAEAVMREVIGDRTIDEVITYGRQEIEVAAQPLLQALVNKYHLGLKIDQIQLKNINPPQPVQESFNDVNKAQQEKQSCINRATGEYNQVIPRAKGEASETINVAKGYASERVNNAKGDADYFNQLLKEYSKAPEATKTRLYLEAMGEVIPKMGNKYIIDSGASKLMPFVLPNLTTPTATLAPAVNQ